MLMQKDSLSDELYCMGKITTWMNVLKAMGHFLLAVKKPQRPNDESFSAI